MVRIRGTATVLGALGTATVLALTGCAPGTEGGGDGDGATLTVLSWRPEDRAGYEKIFAAYEESHPGVEVEFEGIKNTEYLTVLPNELGKSQGGPDVVQLKPFGPIQPLIAGGNLVPLDGKVDLSGFPAEVVAGARGQRDDKIYGVPFALQTGQVLYNERLFAQHQISPPSTWDQFIAACDKLKAAGVTPISTSGLEPWVLAMAHQIVGATRFGGNAFGDAVLSGEKDFTDPAYVDSLRLMNELRPYLPDDVSAIDYPGAQMLFTSGKAAMFPGGSFEVGPFEKNAPDIDIGSFDMPPAPEAPVSQPLTTGWMDGSFGVNANAGNQQAALDLVRWMATKEFGQMYADELTQISPVPGTTPKHPLLARMQRNFESRGARYVMVVDFGYGDPLGRDAEGEAIQRMLSGDVTARQAAREVQKGISAWFEPED